MIISSFKVGWNKNKALPPLFKDDGELTKSQDRAFALQLFKEVLDKREKYDELMKPKIKNWEMDRLAAIDKILRMINYNHRPNANSFQQIMNVSSREE